MSVLPPCFYLRGSRFNSSRLGDGSSCTEQQPLCGPWCQWESSVNSVPVHGWYVGISRERPRLQRNEPRQTDHDNTRVPSMGCTTHARARAVGVFSRRERDKGFAFARSQPVTSLPSPALSTTCGS